jgi:hypothetical protein
MTKSNKKKILEVNQNLSNSQNPNRIQGPDLDPNQKTNQKK